MITKTKPTRPPCLGASQVDSAPECSEGRACGAEPQATPDQALALTGGREERRTPHGPRRGGGLGRGGERGEWLARRWGPSPRSPRGPRWVPRCLSTGRGRAQDREAGARLPHAGGPGPLQQAAAGKHALRGEGLGRGRSGERWRAWGAWAAGLGAAGWREKGRTDGSWDSATRGLRCDRGENGAGGGGASWPGDGGQRWPWGLHASHPSALPGLPLVQLPHRHLEARHGACSRSVRPGWAPFSFVLGKPRVGRGCRDWALVPAGAPRCESSSNAWEAGATVPVLQVRKPKSGCGVT